jgi:hypothetical protein
MGIFDPKSIRNGKAWCDVVNKEPLSAQPTRSVLALGTCKAEGSDFKSYPTLVVRHVPLYDGRFAL